MTSATPVPPNRLDGRSLLDSLIQLTERPDVRAFEASLAATLRDLAGAGVVRVGKLLEGFEERGSKSAAFVAYPDQPASEPYDGRDQTVETVDVAGDACLAECLAVERPVITTHDGRMRGVYPLRLTGGMVGFLVVDARTAEPFDTSVVEGLLRFYRNYVSLLDENQRDKLTGLLNRKTFEEKMLRIIAGLRAAGSRAGDSGPQGKASLALIDIDHFKRVNDEFGHLYGDEVLLVFAQAMTEAFRSDDPLFRIGGEEFLVVLKNVNLDLAMEILERFRGKIERRAFPGVDKITVSIGVSEIRGDDLPTTVLGRADRALYFAKDHGRNQSHAYERLITSGQLGARVQDAGSVELFDAVPAPPLPLPLPVSR